MGFAECDGAGGGAGGATTGACVGGAAGGVVTGACVGAAGGVVTGACVGAAGGGVTMACVGAGWCVAGAFGAGCCAVTAVPQPAANAPISASPANDRVGVNDMACP